MTVLTWPTGIKDPRVIGWRLATNTQIHVSPLDGDEQTLELAGAHWRADLAFPALEEDEWRKLTAFLAELAGPAGRFYYGPVHARLPRGSAGGTPLVNGASQLGTSLVTDGWPTSTTVLKRGDYFHVDNALGGRELKVIRQDIASNGAGAATLVFNPPLRRSPLDNAPITVTSPTAIMRLLDDNQIGFDHMEGGFAEHALTIVESFRP